MARFVAIYRERPDAEAAADFERAYRQTHLPLVARTPGLISAEVSAARKTLAGEPVQFIAEMTFADRESMSAALRTPQWAAAGKNLAEIGGLEIATLVILDDPEPVDLSADTSA